MEILITNDDGYKAKGLRTLVKILRPFGRLTVVAPKRPQSGMSMSVPLGGKPIAVRKLERSTEDERWFYVDASPSSCIKYAVDNIFPPSRPDIVVSGVNHGANYATAAIYSATLAGAAEGAVNRIPALGVSLDNFSDDADFSAVEQLFPGIFRSLLTGMQWKYGLYYNINFPDLEAGRIRGVRPATMGKVHWEREYRDYEGDPSAIENAEEGESFYIMKGDLVDDTASSDRTADHHLVDDGYISITAHNIVNSDDSEAVRISKFLAI